MNFFPGVVVIGSFVVPLSIVVLFFELNVPRNVSLYQVAKMVLLGGALSLVLTMIVGAIVPFDDVGSLIPALLTGVVEEVGKGLVLLLMLRSLRYPYQLNGLLFGAAVGAGFAGFESAGYAFNQALASSSVDAATINILLRGLLAPGGHVIWTAMIGSALWKVKGNRPFAISMLFHKAVLRRGLVAIVLHGLWDTDVWLIPGILWCVLLLIVGWYIVFGILKQALAEVEAAKKEAAVVSSATAMLAVADIRA
jgi:RsiW-degrading membrane proteinase PrsW (M82 family)